MNVKFEALPIKELAQRLHMSIDALQPKIPDQFKLKVGKSVRYDLHGVVDYFRTGENKHDRLLEDLLK